MQGTMYYITARHAVRMVLHKGLLKTKWIQT